MHSPILSESMAHSLHFALAGGQQLSDGFQAFQQAMQDAAQRVQRGAQPRPPGFPPGAASAQDTEFPVISFRSIERHFSGSIRSRQ